MRVADVPGLVAVVAAAVLYKQAQERWVAGFGSRSLVGR